MTAMGLGVQEYLVKPITIDGGKVEMRARISRQMRNVAFFRPIISEPQLEQRDRDIVFMLEHFKLDPFYNEVYSRFYSWHAAEGNGDPLRRFVKEYPDFPNQRVVESDLEKAKAIDRTGLMVDFLELEYPTYSDYVRRFMGKGIAFVPLQRMIQVMLTTKNYQAALERVREFSLCC